MVRRADWTREELEEKYVNAMTAVTVPVNIQLKGRQRILDLSEIKELTSDARLISVGECGCRKGMQKCKAPIDVCICFDEEAEAQMAEGLGKKVSQEDALKVLELSHKAGLVHIAYTFEGHKKPGLVCSCCSCCCHSMSGLVRFGLPNAVIASKYVAVNNPALCMNCGKCVDRCQFRARSLDNGELVYHDERCFGCGLCASTCPKGAISLVKRGAIQTSA